jgi:hypothetical protein
MERKMDGDISTLLRSSSTVASSKIIKERAMES